VYLYCTISPHRFSVTIIVLLSSRR